MIMSLYVIIHRSKVNEHSLVELKTVSTWEVLPVECCTN